MRAVIVGASGGLGRCIATGLGGEDDQLALLARRQDRLESAAAEAAAGKGAIPIPCDVTDEASCRDAIDRAAEAMGGIDGLVYAAGVGPLARLKDTHAETWRNIFDTNVIGASLVTTAAVDHLTESSGTAVYLTSVSASQTPPWPGLGAYAVSKAALDKLVDAWRGEHPAVGFTRLVVGECGGGPGDAMSEFAAGWDLDLAAAVVPTWIERGYMTGALMDVAQLISAVDRILRLDPTVGIPSLTVAPRLVVPDVFPSKETIEAAHAATETVAAAHAAAEAEAEADEQA